MNRLVTTVIGPAACAALTLASLAPTLGCGDREDPGMAVSPTATPAVVPMPPPPVVTPPPMPAAEAPLADAASAHVVTTINTGEIALARMAVERATRADVRTFAQQMIDQHTEAQTSIDGWAMQVHASPMANDVSAAVERNALDVRARLEAASAETFDAMYVQSQVDMHTEALRLIDQRLMPGSEDAAFSAALTTIRGNVSMHLDHARALAGAEAGAMGHGDVTGHGGTTAPMAPQPH